MAHFAVNEIHALLLTAASKAGVSHLDKEGFEILAKKIENEIPRTAHGVFLSYRYLRESIHDKVLEALEEGQEKLGFNRDYIDTLCQFAGYKSFNTFHDHFLKWEKEIQALTSDSQRVAILFSPEDEIPAREIEKIAEQNQIKCSNWSLSINGEEVNHLPDEVLFAIIVLGQSDVAGNTLKLTSQWAHNTSSPVFIYITDPEQRPPIHGEWTNYPVLEPQDRHLFFSIARMQLKDLFSRQNFRAKYQAGPHIQARHIGAVFMGNTRVEAHFRGSDAQQK